MKFDRGEIKLVKISVVAFPLEPLHELLDEVLAVELVLLPLAADCLTPIPHEFLFIGGESDGFALVQGANVVGNVGVRECHTVVLDVLPLVLIIQILVVLIPFPDGLN